MQLRRICGGSSGPYETNTFAGRGSSSSASESFVIDLSTVSTSLGSNDGFGGVEFGSNAGDFNMICMTTAGHVMFLESTTPRCSPDATQTAAGGQWQGFALGAGKTNFQYNGNGMLYQIRNVAPDPDLTAPTIVGGERATPCLDRTITATISDKSCRHRSRHKSEYQELVQLLTLR